MKTKSLTYLMTLAILGWAFSAQAHDPKEHMKDATNPDCAALQNIDQSKMSMDHPVMQAIIKKCLKAGHHDEDDPVASVADTQAQQGDSAHQNSTQHSGHHH